VRPHPRTAPRASVLVLAVLWWAQMPPTTCRLDRRGDVFVLTLCDGENRFNPETVAAIQSALDEVERSTGGAALVSTGEGKFFSNGLALEWMMRGESEGDPGRSHRMLEAVYALLARVLTFPVPTVAAVNGHWFGAGALFGLAHDRRVVRSDRGWFCMPEATLGVGIAVPLFEVLRATLPPPALRDVAVTARRISASEARAAGFVEEVAADDEVVARAIEWAEAHASVERHAIADIKSVMYSATVGILRGDAPGSRAHQPASRRDGYG
jgi:enoyl-CoA hydratase/carnithine racemase